MADTLKQLAKGTLADSNATIYTTPASTTAIVKSIILCNKTSSDATATIKLDGTNVVAAHNIPANDSLPLQLTAILETGDLIEGLSGTTDAIDYYISGIEVV